MYGSTNIMWKYKMNKVWILNITIGVDDYKSRGNCARTESHVYSSKKKCELKLASILVEKTNKKLAKISTCDIPEFIYDLYEIKVSKSNPNSFDYKFTSSLDELFSSINFDDIFEWVAKAEYILCEWNYDISEYIIDDDLIL
jgi:hypothetical protein